MKTKSFVFFVLLFFVMLSSAFHLNAQVVADFTFTVTPASGCPPVSVSFVNTSTPTLGTAYSWVFGNGNFSSTSGNQGALYLTAGTYTVSLTATNSGVSSTHTATIIVFAKPTASFTTSTMPSCTGQTVTFTDNSTVGGGALSSWVWDFGDGNTIPNNTTGTVTHTYATAGVNIPVTMVVTDANGCDNNSTKNVTIAAAPIASFTGSNTSACSPPLTVTFTNTSTITGTPTYLWNFGDGSPTDVSSSPPPHTYSTSGLFDVTLTVTQGACSDQIIKTGFVAISSVVADFTADNTSICAGQTVKFTDSSTPVTGTQSWDFGDGGTSTATNPAHTYTGAGIYIVTLTEGSASCQNTKTKFNYITVSPSPTAAFSTVDTQSCSGSFSVHFTNGSTNGSFYNWSFGDGNTSPLQNPAPHTYIAPGAYSVTLIVTSANGCKDTLTKPNYIVISNPVASFTASPRKGCAPLLVNFTSTSTSALDSIVSYSWTFGDGSPSGTTKNPAHTYAAPPGTYNVKLWVKTAAGCKDSITKAQYIKTGVKPIPGFKIIDSTVCYGTSAEFKDLSFGADSAFWRFDVNEGTFSTPSGTPMPYIPLVANLFPDTGTFYVRQIVFSNGCPDSLQLNQIVTILPPKPIFTYTLNCTNYFTVAFTNHSIGADSLFWDFGDPGSGIQDTSTLQNPSHTYSARGIKNVTLTAWNLTTHCSSPTTQAFTIAKPVAGFNATPFPNIGCYPLHLAFFNTSIDANSDSWSFGDGTTNFSNPSLSFPYIYFTPSKDTVKLVITDVNGCKDSIKHVVIVYGPIPDFSAISTTGCAPFPVTLSDASASDSALVQWTWNFGDGSASQTVNTSPIHHTYSTPGFYTVTMTVKDKNGCKDSLPKPQFIQPTYPFPAFVADTFACRSAAVLFDASTTNVVTPANYTWNFGDGSAIQTVAFPLNTITHAYTSDNLYTVTLTVSDINGCDSSVQHKIRIQQPHADFTDSVPLIGCGVTQMHYRDNSTGLAIVGWQWKFGDGASALQKNPNHNYTVPGPYTVTLIVTNSAGCKDTISKIDTVPGPTGTFSFTPNIGCSPLTVTFTAVSATATSYTWDFGGGAVISNSPNAVIQHTYTHDTIYIPKLILNSILPNGNPCSIPAAPAGVVTVKTIFPHDSLYSNITSGCYPLTVNFFDASTIPPGIPNDTINSWTWDFGDGTASTLKNPTHVYADSGHYPVTIKVTTYCGCGNNNLSAPYFITVHSHPVAAFKVNLTNFDLPYDALICTNQSTGASDYNWNFGDGSTSTLLNPQYLYSSVGTFQIQLIATSQFGCTDTAYKKVVTNSDVIFPNAFSPNSNGPSGGAYTLFSTDNDVFFPYVYGVIDYQLDIFDRWGQQVFESLEIKKGWDGYYKGKLCDQGVYVWKAYVKLNNGKEFYKNGDVTLIR